MPARLRRLHPFIVVALGAVASVHCRSPEPTPPVELGPAEAGPSSDAPRVDDWTDVSEQFGERRVLSTGTVTFHSGTMALVRPPQGRAQLWDLRSVPPRRQDLEAGPNPDDAKCERLRSVSPHGDLVVGDGVLCTIDEPRPGAPGIRSMRAVKSARQGRFGFWRFGPDDVRVIESANDRKTWKLRQHLPPPEGPLADGVELDIDGVTIGRDSASGILWCTPRACKEAPLLDAIEGRWQSRPVGLHAHRIQRYWWLDDTLMLVDNAMQPPRVLRVTSEPDEPAVEELCRFGREPSWNVETWSVEGVHRVVTLSTMDSPVVWRIESGRCVLEQTLPAEGQWFRSVAYVPEIRGLGDVLWLGAHAPSGEDTVVLRALPMRTGQLQVGAQNEAAAVVDWSPAPFEQLGMSGPASEEQWPQLVGTARLDTDESFQLDVDLRNVGSADSWWTRVRVTSTPADALPDGFFEIPVGRLEPGEHRTIEVPLPIRSGWREHEVGFVVRWSDAHERSTGGARFSWWPDLVQSADDEDRLAQSIIEAGARVLDQVTGEPQRVRGSSLDPHEYGFYTSYGGRVHYQRMHGMEPTPLAVNREVWQARSADELERLVVPMQWWLLPHELGHTRVQWGGWDEEFLAAWVGVLLTRRLLGDDPESLVRQGSMVRFYEQVVRRLDPQIDPALAERVRLFLAARGKQEPPGGLFQRFTPSTVLRDDPATYVWFLGRVSLWALEQPETLEDLLGTATEAP
ncbi:MAG: hypothetical protein AAF799_39680 [Myxococcota bacterium]